jgi:acetyl-CoA C-acetyltransferase
MRKVSVIGIGETKYGKHPDMSLRTLISEAANKAIRDSGIDPSRLEALFIGNFNGSQLNGQSLISALAAEEIGLGNISAIRVEAACASGGAAFRMGYTAILSGLYDIVIVGGVEKMTHQSGSAVTEAIATAMDHDAETSVGLTFPGLFAMIANRYFHEYRNVKKEMALCAINAHHNATLNPDAQLPKELDLETVLEAPVIADPFSQYDCSLVTDGAAFAVLAADDALHGHALSRAVKIIGSGQASDVLRLARKSSLTSFAASVKACAEAYGMAEIGPKDIDLAEVHDCFTITQIINTEDLGFFERGKGADAVADGITTLDGRRPINPSGGLKAKGHPIGATGIGQIFEIVTQIRNESGERQVGKADIGLTHNLGGAAAVCLVHIFQGR